MKKSTQVLGITAASFLASVIVFAGTLFASGPANVFKCSDMGGAGCGSLAPATCNSGAGPAGHCDTGCGPDFSHIFACAAGNTKPTCAPKNGFCFNGMTTVVTPCSKTGIGGLRVCLAIYGTYVSPCGGGGGVFQNGCI